MIPTRTESHWQRRVENVLCDQEGVVEAAVIGHPDPILGERAVAYVHAGAALLPEQVRAFGAARMADYKVPDWVLVCDEPLPGNANGKIQKDQLRRRAAQDVAGRAASREGGQVLCPRDQTATWSAASKDEP